MSTETQALQRYSLSGATMGTRYSAVLYAAAGLNLQVIRTELQQAVDQVDQQMSTWNPQSDLMQLNAASCGQWLSVPDELMWVLSSAVRISAESEGAFEIGVGALVSACGFGPEKPLSALPGKQPSAREVLDIDPGNGRVRKQMPITLDLNGIAKGFAVDQLARCLERHGITSYLVSIDGEMRVSGVKADGSEWCVALEKPIKGQREVLGSLALSNTSIATSGDYRHWREREGTVFSHTMNPHTGAPLLSELASVSVLCTSCMYADAWATALMVFGVERGAQLAKAKRLSAIFVLRDGDALREVTVGL
ncbi:FAD:protein FMN transferase [Pseudomonas sp. TMP25]|uniref:FAD:protein FMN transferase n=1 Tax=Pseudomonas sp. TMP25 TaxID=3136561 RepID=UPI003100AE0D